MTKYDDASWHSEGDFPADLDPFQAHIHPGMFLGWLIDQGLTSDEFRDDFGDEIAAFQARDLTGPRLPERLDGVLIDDMLDDVGNRFTAFYYPETSIADFDQTLAADLPTPYHVADTWENYDRWAKLLYQRFGTWWTGAR